MYGTWMKFLNLQEENVIFKGKSTILSSDLYYFLMINCRLYEIAGREVGGGHHCHKRRESSWNKGGSYETKKLNAWSHDLWGQRGQNGPTTRILLNTDKWLQKFKNKQLFSSLRIAERERDETLNNFVVVTVQTLNISTCWFFYFQELNSFYIIN